jgi:uncharacterized protein (TIGR02444 family)
MDSWIRPWLRSAGTTERLRRLDRAATISRTMSETDATPSLQGSPFWRFSLRLYREPGVADACIALQEESGVDVNLLMYLLWHATRRRSFTPDEVGWIESKVAPWREAIVVPLRSVRRALKTAPSLVSGIAAESFRVRIKALELEAERLQQEAMYEFDHATPAGDPEAIPAEAARHSLAAYETICPSPFAAAARDAVLLAFAKQHPNGE